MTKIFLCMSVIPSRVLEAQFWDNLDLLKQQIIPFETLFISIPKMYKRFPNLSIDLEKFDNYDWITIIPLEIDYGPASKYMGPLLHQWNRIKDNILIVIDDDREYHSKMGLLYQDFFSKHENIHVASGNRELYFNTFFYQGMDPNFLDIREARCKYVSGFMSFALHCRHDWTPLIEYTCTILEKFPDSFFHDEAILLNYFRCFGIGVYYINFKMIKFVKEEMIDALCESTLDKRTRVEQECLDWTMTHYKIKTKPWIQNSKLRRKYLLG